MSAFLFVPPRSVALNSVGRTLSGAKRYFYLAGTNTAATVYTSAAKTAARSQPVVATSAGEFPACYVDVPVKVTEYTSGNVLRWTEDNIPPTGAAPQEVGESLYPIGDSETSVSDYRYPLGNVLRYGADPTGVVNSAAAFDAAWEAIKESGGEVVVPPGSYLLNSQWVLTQSATARVNYRIAGYGAVLTTGASAASAIKIVGTAANFGVFSVEGFKVDHRNNANASSAFIVQGACHVHLSNLMVEADDNSASYSAIWVGPRTAGNDDTNSFWVVIDRCNLQRRSSGDGAMPPVGILLSGAANATKITNCSIANFSIAVKLAQDGVGNVLANSVRILQNDFEACTTAIHVVTTDAVYETEDARGPTGLQIAFNRCEATTNFFKFDGAATLDHSFPPVLFCNYLTVGSVTNYLVNPNSQYVFSLEPSYFADQGQDNWIGGPNNFTVVTEGAGKNFQIQNISGAGGSYDGAHLVLGAYHLWVEAATGFLRIKDSAPAADDEGTIVGVQAPAP